ncbi:MAG: hypothetical protein DME98_03570 [Verrucomicrobia bacterium]|nr:MAG: hypothetical protein DME98_03570 [Verrucomicrobiota bacterium]PYJ32778.1 MAG: hypothetical protein DME88_09780 [Verrucomicrobiota bacterium]
MVALPSAFGQRPNAAGWQPALPRNLHSHLHKKTDEVLVSHSKHTNNVPEFCELSTRVLLASFA